MSADTPEKEPDDRPRLRDDEEGGAPLERKRDVLKERIQEVVGASPMGFLATSDIDQPRVRPVAPLLDDLTFWIVTFHDSPKVREINDNPKVSLAFAAMFDEEFATVNVLGRAEMVTDPAIKERIWDTFPEEIDLFQYFSGVDDARFGLIRIDPRRIECTRPGRPQPDVYHFD